MRKLRLVIIALFSIGTVNTGIMTTTNFQVKQNIIKDSVSSKPTDFMYSGYLLRYFILKSSNITTNLAINTLEQNIVNNKNTLYASFTSMQLDLNNVTMINSESFEMALISSIVNISMYGMTTWRDFFAEAYAKWTTTPDEMKNKSWEILNEFFLNVYPNLQQQFFGNKIDYYQNSIDYIDNFFQNTNPVIYDTTLVTKPSDAVDLKYSNNIFGNSFGLQQPFYFNNAIGYRYVAFINGLLSWAVNGSEDYSFNYDTIINQFSPIQFQNYIINNDNILSTSLRNMMNDSYTKASQSAINEYNQMLADGKKTLFSTFDDLSTELKKSSAFQTSSGASGSTIDLKNSIEAMGSYYNWQTSQIEIFKNQMLDLYNTSYTIVGKDFKYFLLGIIFSPDNPLSGTDAATAGYTSGALYQINQNTFLSLVPTFIVYSIPNAFNSFLNKQYSDQYQNYQWWSSPNIFATLNHEMGHVVDMAYGWTNTYRQTAAKDYQNLINTYGLKGLYNGNIFGYNYPVSQNKQAKIIEIVLITFFTIFVSSVIGVIIWTVCNKKRKN